MKTSLKIKHFPLLIILLIGTLLFFKSNSVNNIPQEDPKSQTVLDKAITLSKLDTDNAISNLENIDELSGYTEYKKDYILAKLYEEKNDFNKAILIYEKLLDKNYPLKERVIFHYAYLNTRLGNDLVALKYFNRLIREFPYSHSVPQAKYYLAQTQLRLRFTKDALNTLSTLKSRYPKTQFGIATNYYLGENAYNNKRFKEALEYWREYLKLSPDGRFANEISVFFSRVKPYLKSDDYSLLGEVFFYKKDYAKAAKYYKIGNNIQKYYKLGYSLIRTGNNSEACNYLKEFAYHFPKSKHAKQALLFSSKSVPSFMKKSFWEKVEKDIPGLAYYALYKQAILEENDIRREHKLLNLIDSYPNTEFTLDAVWEIMWDKIKDRKYNEAGELGGKYFELSKDSSVNSKSDTRAKIGFWLGKICELKSEKVKAKEYYTVTANILFDNYYSFRAQNRLLALNGQKDFKWNVQTGSNVLNEDLWSIPSVVKYETAKKCFGVTVAELIRLQQYSEAIDLIGKSKSPSKKITAWLKALNSEYENSINISSSIISNYSLNQSSQMWRLAYPLHFWQYILNTSSRYKNVDPFLVCALIRQESKYDPYACSISNACGLMQLIIPTAKEISRELKVNVKSRDVLFDPQTNIVFGIHYLNGLIGELNNPLLAVAGYNAGPVAVKSWVSKFQENDMDFFVEKIPYDETRNYVKKVFSNYWTYLKLYNIKS
ncbi:MAG: hypothetical protein A3I68_01820 [Candidatus Melainabacteria bacterium RIFCSPLOWO2_02_FULL_35_15]|nr:MAG: hypothetical protein A3F80_09545 [Candidatus Melainabacteria bacterium RIFCSPLOWO2_12_FULL_35_11]OGI14292.1 MAG: hypothetical protein A3I68_01820 [Candidatus Melainabacteria bacterium RIFCSPLOWO2_02_FULL_35_15]